MAGCEAAAIGAQSKSATPIDARWVGCIMPAPLKADLKYGYFPGWPEDGDDTRDDLRKVEPVT